MQPPPAPSSRSIPTVSKFASSHNSRINARTQSRNTAYDRPSTALGHYRSQSSTNNPSSRVPTSPSRAASALGSRGPRDQITDNTGMSCSLNERSIRPASRQCSGSRLGEDAPIRVSKRRIPSNGSPGSGNGYQRQASITSAIHRLQISNRPASTASTHSELRNGHSTLHSESRPSSALSSRGAVNRIAPSCRLPQTPRKIPFLTRDSNTPAAETKSRLENVEAYIGTEKKGLQEALEVYKLRGKSVTGITNCAKLTCAVHELETIRSDLKVDNHSLQQDVETTQSQLKCVVKTLQTERTEYDIRVDELRQRLRNDVESATTSLRQDLEKTREEKEEEIRSLKRIAQEEEERAMKRHRDEAETAERKSQVEREIDEVRHRSELSELDRRKGIEIQQLQDGHQKALRTLEEEVQSHTRKAESSLEERDKDFAELQQQTQVLRDVVQKKCTAISTLEQRLEESAAARSTLDLAMRSLKARIDHLESDGATQSHNFAEMQRRLQDAQDAEAAARERLLKEETIRRKLHNQIQELKGNIRVFCRVRPGLDSDSGTETAQIAYPDIEEEDAKQISVRGQEEKSSLGKDVTKTHPFGFDRVFGPSSTNEQIYGEISQLVQSALDGYNVCIFCYGQTGAGKTYTMNSADGMIPRATRQIYECAIALEDKGWKYEMKGSFVEVYNEALNDLLCSSKENDKKKMEIRHDEQQQKTAIQDCTEVQLDSADTVESILSTASRNRTVAKTLANERSSRSHSVFILKLKGVNAATGERSEGTLNLVDLAGSERLNHSGSTGERLKETQSINRSLSCLGDVIGALGQQGKDAVGASAVAAAHIPYRNSKVSSAALLLSTSPPPPPLVQTLKGLAVQTC